MGEQIDIHTAVVLLFKKIHKKDPTREQVDYILCGYRRIVNDRWREWNNKENTKQAIVERNKLKEEGRLYPAIKCKGCRRRFEPTWHNNKYCSTSCRTRTYRRKKPRKISSNAFDKKACELPAYYCQYCNTSFLPVKAEHKYCDFCMLDVNNDEHPRLKKRS